MKNTWLVFIAKHKLIFLKQFFLIFFNFFNFFNFFLKNSQIKQKYFYFNDVYTKNILIKKVNKNNFFIMKTILFSNNFENVEKHIKKIKAPFK
jgi:hypothetical protein